MNETERINELERIIAKIYEPLKWWKNQGKLWNDLYNEIEGYYERMSDVRQDGTDTGRKGN